MPHFADVNLFILMYSRLQHPEGKKKKKQTQSLPATHSLFCSHSSLISGKSGIESKGSKV